MKKTLFALALTIMALTAALTLTACTTAEEPATNADTALESPATEAGTDSEGTNLEAGLADLETEGAAAMMFTISEEEAREMALEAVPGEIFNVTTVTNEYPEADLILDAWHVIIDTPEDGRVVVEIVKATGELTILPLRR